MFEITEQLLLNSQKLKWNIIGDIFLSTSSHAKSPSQGLPFLSLCQTVTNDINLRSQHNVNDYHQQVLNMHLQKLGSYIKVSKALEIWLLDLGPI